jgi:hypothetical protein
MTPKLYTHLIVPMKSRSSQCPSTNDSFGKDPSS